MAEKKRAARMEDVLAAKKTVTIQMRSTSGKVFDIECDLLNARVVDEIERLYPLGVRPLPMLDKDGKLMKDDEGVPRLANETEIRAALAVVGAKRATVQLAAAVRPEFWGNKLLATEQKVEFFETEFDRLEIANAAAKLGNESVITPADKAEAHEEMAPFVSTAAAPAPSAKK